MTNDGEAPVHIEPYDASWPDLFRAEERLLRTLLARWLAGPIEHVGSTAVEGLAAKPVIDVMVAVASLDASRTAIPVLERSGYRYADYKTDVMHWFCKPDFSFRTHHLHLVPFASRLWHERIGFRDHLRANRDVARDYAELKLHL